MRVNFKLITVHSSLVMIFSEQEFKDKGEIKTRYCIHRIAKGFGGVT